MVRHWEDLGVPTYIAVSAYLGLTKASRSGKKVVEEEQYSNLDELEKMFAGTGGLIQ